MSKKKNTKSAISVKDILKGKFLVDDSSMSNWRFLMFMAFLGIVIISSAHWVDRKVVLINEIEEEVSSLKSQYTDAHRTLMGMQLETEIIKHSSNVGIKLTENQPYVIIKKVDE